MDPASNDDLSAHSGVDNMPVRHGHRSPSKRQLRRGVSLCTYTRALPDLRPLMIDEQEELMEADLHAIVSPMNLLTGCQTAFSTWFALTDPLRPAVDRRPLPILHLPNSLWIEIHPLRKRPAPRLEARELASQRRL